MKEINRKLKVVLTDDDEDDRDFFEQAISDLKIDCDLHLFHNGKELIDYLNLNTEVPDIVFLDLNMPILSGLDSLQMIRNNEKFNRTPVIAIYTTSSNDMDKQKSIEQGANAYITKPNDFSDLKKLLNKVLMIDWKLKLSKVNTLEDFVIK